jgi:hypothetical protein
MSDDYKIHAGTLYDYTASSYCGVLVKESVMKKLVKLQAQHLDDVKRILADGADKGDVYPSMWTLHYPQGDQETVHFIDTSIDVRDRIKNATYKNQPIVRPLVFIAGSMQEAKQMADAMFAEREPA